MTKVTIIGEKTQSKYKHIKFLQVLTTKFHIKEVEGLAIPHPKDWRNIELICRDYADGKDLMFAYDDDRSLGVLYIGYFNQGLV